LLSVVRRLEGKSDRGRKRVILDYLTEAGIPYELHRYREWFVPTDNIVITKPGSSRRQILLLSHYDTYHGNPGANDNASSVAVAIETIRQLISKSIHCTIKALIFDDEEQSPLRPRPCLGSRKYVSKIGVKDIAGVFCLELCGFGDSVAIWPVADEDKGSRMLEEVTSALAARKIRYELIPRLPGFTSDFMPFRKAGVRDAFCFTAAPSGQRDKLLRTFSTPILKLLFTVEIPKLLGMTKHLPEMIRYYHTRHDTADTLSEDSLQMMVRAMYEGVLAYDEFVRKSDSDELLT